MLNANPDRRLRPHLPIVISSFTTPHQPFAITPPSFTITPPSFVITLAAKKALARI